MELEVKKFLFDILESIGSLESFPGEAREFKMPSLKQEIAELLKS